MTFARSVEIEMEGLLRQMYVDMNAQQTIPLDQLAVANPELYAQMRTAAEATVSANSNVNINVNDRGNVKTGGVQGRGGVESTATGSASTIESNNERKLSLRSSSGLGSYMPPKGQINEGIKGRGSLVNAFIAEAPVVLDLGRAECLLKQLLATEKYAKTISDAESLFDGNIVFCYIVVHCIICVRVFVQTVISQTYPRSRKLNIRDLSI